MAKATIAKQAESKTQIAFRVMAGRTDECVSIPDPTAQHRIDHGECASDGKPGNLIAARPKRRQRRGLATPRVTLCLDQRDVVARMESGEIILVGGLGFQRFELVEQS